MSLKFNSGDIVILNKSRKIYTEKKGSKFKIYAMHDTFCTCKSLTDDNFLGNFFTVDLDLYKEEEINSFVKLQEILNKIT